MLRDVLISKGLSNREAEVAELVTQGLSNKEVANRLFVTEKTVKFHLTNIYKKMSVKSRAQLIVWCLPHMSFIEKDQTGTAQQEPARAINQMPVGQQNVTNTIPAGNQTIGGINPGAGNTDLGGGNNTGNGFGGNTGGSFY